MEDAPPCVLEVASHCVALIEIDGSALALEVLEHVHKLLVSFALMGCLVLLKEDVRLIVHIERPVVLIEAAQGHDLAIIDIDRLHMQILEGLFMHYRTTALKS